MTDLVERLNAAVAEGGKWSTCFVSQKDAREAAETIAAQETELTTLRQQLAAAQANEARYLWLRDVKRVSEGVEEGNVYIGIESRECWALAEEAADAVIDQAMKELLHAG